jgi:photosystem II stability/assembly factor-like uncharacterized protein
MRTIRLAFASLVLALGFGSPAMSQRRTPAPPPVPTLDTLVYQSLKFRALGPAVMGGRMSAFAARPGSSTIFAATGTGGLFKTTNNGNTWSAVFEKEAVASIGAVALSVTDTGLVWVGSGEGNGRNSSSWGNGVYKSTDGGGKWTQMGLDNTHDIPAMAVDPRNPDVVWVAALGHLWGKNPERGVYKTTDGGKTWNAVLQLGDSVGAVDLVLDPVNPDVAYAAMYQRLRSAWSFRSGGPVGGIYKTTDGGRSWTKLTAGLPTQTGRIGLDIYPLNPQVLYAVIESDEGGPRDLNDIKSRAGGVFRTDDGGATWRRMHDIAPRAFYFSKVRIDPTSDARIYVLGFGLHVSDDSGHTFRADGAEKPHGDLHALWVDPANRDRLVLGTDGGIYFSWDAGKNWTFVNNVATGEFYEVTYDYRTPYRVCGGLQDNGSWCGPSRKRAQDGIWNGDWFRIGDCDGYYVQVDSTDPDIVYGECQGGEAYRVNLRNNQVHWIKPRAKEGSPGFRFNWDSPLAISRFDQTVLYLGGNRLFRFTERGDRWEAVSPDLSTQNPETMVTAGSSAETYNTIVSFAESPLSPAILWAGTDDGNIQVTRDGGASWTNVAPNLKGLPKSNLYIARIEASRFDSATAYVAIDGHRSDVFQPLVFVTTDFGRKWSPIAANLPAGGPVKSFREDPVNPDLLFAGTEFALYFSLDRGKSWNRFRNGLPTVAFDDIQIHPRDHDLIVGTHGRSIYILDDITGLEGLTPAVRDSAAWLFPIRPVQPFWKAQENGLWGQDFYVADNPPAGAYINFYLRNFSIDDVSITIADSASGMEVAKLSARGNAGLNRVVWDLQPKESLRTRGEGEPTEFVRAGTYSVTLSAAGKTLKQQLVVVEPVR